MGVVRNPGEAGAAFSPGFGRRRFAGSVTVLRSASPARLLGAAALLVLACLAIGPQAAAQNQPPTASNNTVTTNEDTAYTFDAGDFNFSDVDTGDTLAKVKIVTLPGAGTLARSGTAVTANQEIAKADIDGNRLVFTPAANANGSSYASFTFKVNDGTAESASSYTMTVDVDAVNDAPTASNNTVTTNEDTAYTFGAGDFNFSDVDTGDTLAKVKIVTLPGAGTLARSGTAVTANQEIAKADIDGNRLVFTPAANANGSSYASFTFKVNDGTAESASSYTMTIDVTSVNDPPTAVDGEVTTLEDTPYSFAADDFNFSDPVENDTLASVRIVTLPARGTLTSGDAAVRANQAVARAKLDNGELVFTPAANGNGEPYASFTFRVSDGGDESVSTYTMTVRVTPTVETGMVKSWNARLGRTIGGQVVDAMTARFEYGGKSHVFLGGRRVGGSAPRQPEPEPGSADRPATTGMTGAALLRSSAFLLSVGEVRKGGAYAMWGRVAHDAFEMRADALTVNGGVTTGILGFDGAWGRTLAGVAVALSESGGSFRQVASEIHGTDDGTIESRLAGVYPFARVVLGEGLAGWGMVGYGSGKLTLKPKDQPAIQAGLAMRMGALGVKGRVLDGAKTGGVSLSVKSDAMWVRTESGGARNLGRAEGNARRLRLIFDAKREFDDGQGGTLTPKGEIGLRYDRGDAETGAGLELGAGLRYAVSALTVDGGVRVLVAHRQAGHREWGASGSVALAPDPQGRGLSFSLRPVWGQAESGTGALWSLADAGDLVTGRAAAPAGRLDARLGYGFAVFGNRLTVTPEIGLQLARSHRRYSLRWRLEPARPWRGGFDLLLEATRQEAANDDRPREYGVNLRLTGGW